MLRMATSDIPKTLKSVLERVALATQSRNEDVAALCSQPRLVAVSKTKPQEMIIEAYRAGQIHFGENYAAELIEKGNSTQMLEQCPNIKWHMIGHVQTNKVKKVVTVPNLYIVETVDSPKLANSLNKSWESLKKEHKLKVFVQVNTSNEETKHGVTPDEVTGLVGHVLKSCPHLEFSGLMTIGAFDHDLSKGPNRDFQTLLRCRATVCEAHGLEPVNVELSMGMSNDFEHAASFIPACNYILDSTSIKSCNVFLIGLNSNFTEELFDPLANLIQGRENTYQDIMDLHPLISARDFDWDWEGRFVFFTRSPTADISRAALSYKMTKVKRALYVSDQEYRDKKQTVRLYNHVLYSSTSIQLLTSFIDGKILNEVEIFPPKLNFNFQGQKITISTFPFEPSVIAVVDKDGYLQNATGVDIKFSEAMGQALNFVPIFKDPGIHHWGFYFENGTYTNLFYEASYGEALMGICNVFLSSDRAEIMTFSYPYDYDNTKFIAPLPGKRPPFLSILLPFSLYVWILLVATLILLIMFIPSFAAFLTLQDKALYHTLGGSVLVSVGLFTNRSFVLPKNVPLKVLIGTFVIGGFLTALYYSSNLIAFMTISETEEPIKTIRQIAENDAIRVGSMGSWILEFPSTQQILPKYYDIKNVMEGIPDVLAGRAVIVQIRQHLEFLVRNYLTIKGKPVVRLVEENANYFPIAAILQRHSPLASSIQMIILRLQAGGMMSKFFAESLSDARYFDVGHNNDEVLSNLKVDEGTESVQPLTFDHLQGLLLAVGIGYSFSLIAVLIERATQILQDRN